MLGVIDTYDGDARVGVLLFVVLLNDGRRDGETSGGYII